MNSAGGDGGETGTRGDGYTGEWGVGAGCPGDGHRLVSGHGPGCLSDNGTMAVIHDSLIDTVGRTPLMRLSEYFKDAPATVLGKLESFNPASSVKDRTALAIIRAAEADGRLKPGGTIIEASSGNTGIALAWIGTRLGYTVIITLPDDVSLERRQLLSALGAEVVLTPGPQAMAGANQEAGRILERTPGAFLSGQGGNAANPQVHFDGTGPEIWADTDGEVDVLVATVGTGGTLTGAARYLRERNPELVVVAVEPAEAPVIRGEWFSPHKIQGIIGGNGYPPIFDVSLVDHVVDVPGATAKLAAQRLARVEGIISGYSSGAAVAAAHLLTTLEEFAGKTIVAVLPDTGERYLSSGLFDSDDLPSDLLAGVTLGEPAPIPANVAAERASQAD